MSPLKDKAKRKAYHRNYMKRLREKLRIRKRKAKESEIDSELKKGNLNFGLNATKLKFMPYKQYKSYFPKASFEDYMREKTAFLKKQKELNVSKFPKGEGTKWEGVNLWQNSEYVEPKEEPNYDEETTEELREYLARENRKHEKRVKSDEDNEENT